MENEKKDINWNEIIKKFSEHKGTIANFCRENNIKPQQLYRQRKKLEKESTTTFHAINMSKAIDKPLSSNEKIRIEIGNAKIFIPKGDKATLQYILKELSNIC